MTNLHTFPRELRLLTPSQFSEVFSSNIRISSPLLTFVIKKNTLAHARVGFAIAKKQIKRAHERNRIKRLIREYIRLNQHNLPNIDIVIMARQPIQNAPNSEINRLLEELIKKAIKRIATYEKTVN